MLFHSTRGIDKNKTFEEKFLALTARINKEIENAIDKDEKLLLLGRDLDSSESVCLESRLTRAADPGQFGLGNPLFWP